MSDARPLEFSPGLSAEETRKRTELSEDFFTVYSNYSRVTVSQTDFRIFVGENYLTALGEVKVKEMFSIAMTPQQTKVLANLLASTISSYEKTFGEIRLMAPPQKEQATAETPPQEAPPTRQ